MLQGMNFFRTPMDRMRKYGESGYPDRSRIVGNVCQNDGVRTDAHVITDANLADDNRAYTEFHVVPNLRGIVAGVAGPNAHVVPQRAVTANGRTVTNHDSTEVIYEQSRADACPSWEMYPNNQRDEAVKNNVRGPEDGTYDGNSDPTTPLADAIRQNGD
jgi:hypothetical protein